MPFGLPNRENEISPFNEHVGKLVDYSTQGGRIIGIYSETKDHEGNYKMIFQPSLVQDSKGYVNVITDRPTIVTNFSGIMRPVQENKSIEKIADEINLETNNDKKA